MMPPFIDHKPRRPSDELLPQGADFPRAQTECFLLVTVRVGVEQPAFSCLQSLHVETQLQKMLLQRLVRDRAACFYLPDSPGADHIRPSGKVEADAVHLCLQLRLNFGCSAGLRRLGLLHPVVVFQPGLKVDGIISSPEGFRKKAQGKQGADTATHGFCRGVEGKDQSDTFLKST